MPLAQRYNSATLIQGLSMPELPEVETMRRGILPIVGGRVSGAERVASPRRPILISPRIDLFRRRAVGRSIVEVARAGKRVVIVLDSGDRIVMEPRMTGLVLLADPPTREHLRFRLSLKGAGAAEVCYWDRRGLGSVRLFSAAEFARQFGPEKLGPDALELSADVLRERLGESRRAIKVALLDQRAVAGIGNLYASEILHRAGVHPARRCDRLRPPEWERICAATDKVLRDAVRYEGSTLADGTYRNALNESGGYQNHHLVYDRAGESCRRCKTDTIVRVVQAQRSTFYCPTCQTKTARSRAKTE
jgi:formamidopyrimidine-DNA glycosylase